MGARKPDFWMAAKVWEDFCSLGRREGVEIAADPQAVGNTVDLWREDYSKYTNNLALVPLDDDAMSALLVGTAYSAEKKGEIVGRALDQVVEVAGSRWFFGGVLSAITGWAVAGAVTGAPDLWQIIFQDVSSIQCYFSDMILMRQQMNDFREHLRIIALLRSRSYTITACFRFLIEQGRLEIAGTTSDEPIVSFASTDQSPPSCQTDLMETVLLQQQPSVKNSTIFEGLEDAIRDFDVVGDPFSLSAEDFLDRVIVKIADALGSFWMLAAFITGIIAWISLGPKYNFGNNWQLWLNTSTALQQTFYTCLLTLARNRHSYFVEKCMCAIFRYECELEYRSRALTQYKKPNEVVEIQLVAKHRFERALDWYGAFIGSGYGAFLSLVLFVVWIATGDLMGWGDNWWLIIGTWTGVVGTFNSAVLRYSLYQEEERSSKEYGLLTEQDKELFAVVGLECPEHKTDTDLNLMTRISKFISRICATRWAVFAVLSLITGLLVGATVALWNETAQLLVNSVTMIVESFFLIVLIKAHNMQATDHRIRLHDLLVRRLQLLVIHRRIEMDEVASSMDTIKLAKSDSIKISMDE